MATPPMETAPGHRPVDRAERNFPRSSRLLDKAHFDHVFSRAQRSGDQYFTVLYRSNDRVDSRLGLAIAKKRVRRAVDRNRLKRLIRQSFRHAKMHLIGVDIVIMARDRAKTATNDELFASLAGHWRAIGETSASGEADQSVRGK